MLSIFSCTFYMIYYLYILFGKNFCSDPLPIFNWVIDFLILSCISPLHSLDINSLMGLWFENIVSYSISCFFILLMVSFAVQKLLVICHPFCLFFILLHVLLVSPQKNTKSLPRLMSRSLPFIFSSKNFTVSNLMFKSISTWFFVHGIREWSSFIVFMWLFSLPSTINWRDSSFPIVYIVFFTKPRTHEVNKSVWLFTIVEYLAHSYVIFWEWIYI